MSDSNTPTPLASELIEDMKNWVIQPPRQNQKGGYSSFVNRRPGDISKIRFQTTCQNGELPDDIKCVAPFAISEPYDKNADANRRNVVLNIKSKHLHAFLAELDRWCLAQAQNNVDVWFGSGKKKVTAEQVEGLYKPLVTASEGKDKNGNDKNWGDSFKVKVNVGGDNKVRVYQQRRDGNAVSVPPDMLPKQANVVCLVEVTSVWFMPKEFGISLTCTDILFDAHVKSEPAAFRVRPTIVDAPRTMDEIEVDYETDPRQESALSSS